MIELTQKSIQHWLPLREPDAHKGDFGRLLMIAGSRGMMGACVLACRAAFRSGAGLVAACCSPSLFSDVHAGVPEATCVSREDFDPGRYDAVAIGPGLIIVSLRQKKEDQPPASLGLPYFREER